MFEKVEDPFRDLQKTNGRGHTPLPQGNTNPTLSSVLPSTSMLEIKDTNSQAQLVRGIRDLPPGIYQVGNKAKTEWIVLGRTIVSHTTPGATATTTPTAASILPLTNVAPAAPASARDLELAGEVALFREIMKDWDLNDHQASLVLGYQEPTFATDLFKGLTSIRHRDAEQRLDLVITIAVDIEALYRDHDTIRKWLRKPHELLDGAIPIVMLTEGSSLDLLKLGEYVEYLSGR